ncbi:MFS general substrate transporter [Aulographum hederae CBS 113979]|uniref:MFS general substrate transporter n=1 Tax=Aulographum hederae CBS 113979 TaxID=1176131 RepID=A0A6G1GNH2_9PEZI|nr:MFS general substrate transporter [Aulographum hederae CBS 113979]
MTKRKLPVQQLVILGKFLQNRTHRTLLTPSAAICRFAEPISLTSVYPYLPEMIESFNVPKNDIARWAGLTSSIYSICQCVTAISWGRLSDRIGRKSVILICLTNTMIMSLLWGFSTSLPMAMVARALSGAGNGNVGIIRTMVAEMCPWKELQPRAFSIMPLVYNVGSVIGPSIGGLLSNPYHVSPKEPAHGSLLERFPYALPNIVSAICFFVGITTGFLFLRETLETRKYQRDLGLTIGKRIQGFSRNQVQRLRGWILQESEEEIDPLIKSTPTTYTAVNDEEASESTSKAREVKSGPPSFREVLNRQAVLNLAANSLLCCHSISFDQLLSVFMHHPRQDMSSPDVQLPFKFAGGFGINSSRIGIIFTLYGVFNIFFQFVIFPPCARKWGVLNCMRICTIAFPLVYFFAPFSTLMPTPIGKEIFLFLLWSVKGLAGSFGFPSSTILLTNSATSLRTLGTLNGISTAISAVGRAIGPTIAGAAFTLGAKEGYIILPFWVLSAMSLLNLIPVFMLIEGDGFGGDDDPDDLEADEGHFEDSDEDAVEDADEASDEAEADDLGPLLSRQSTYSSGFRFGSRHASVVSSAVASTVDEDEYGSEDERGSLSRRESRAVPRGRRSRRSSVPVGMGQGFRKLSTNLGVSGSGYGYSGSFAG